MYFGSERNGDITKLHIKELLQDQWGMHCPRKKSCPRLNLQRKEPVINKEKDTILHNFRQKQPGDWQSGSQRLLSHNQERWKGFKLWHQRKGKDHLTLKEPDDLNSVLKTISDLYHTSDNKYKKYYTHTHIYVYIRKLVIYPSVESAKHST